MHENEPQCSQFVSHHSNYHLFELEDATQGVVESWENLTDTVPFSTQPSINWTSILSMRIRLTILLFCAGEKQLFCNYWFNSSQHNEFKSNQSKKEWTTEPLQFFRCSTEKERKRNRNILRLRMNVFFFFYKHITQLSFTLVIWRCFLKNNYFAFQKQT